MPCFDMFRYMKHEIAAERYGEDRFTSVTWHSEDPLRITLTTYCKPLDPRSCAPHMRLTASLIVRSLGWETHASRATLPFDSGTVAVIDGGTHFIVCIFVAQFWVP